MKIGFKRAAVVAAGIGLLSASVAVVQTTDVKAAGANYATVTKKRYPMWNSVSFGQKWHNTSNWYHHSFKITKSVKKGSARYYQLSRNGQNFGFVNAAAVKTASGSQGAAIGTKRYVSFTKKGYPAWNSFGWQTKKHYSQNYLNRTFLVKNVYYHSSGSTYLSIYRSGRWFGYINQGATKTVSGKQGAAVKTSQTLQVSKKGFYFYSNFSWQKRHASKTYYGKNISVKNAYYHYNGSTYYSAYSGSKWLGYISASATKPATKYAYVAATSKTVYHLRTNCKGLSNANKSQLKKITLAQAKAQHRHLCRFE